MAGSTPIPAGSAPDTQAATAMAAADRPDRLTHLSARVLRRESRGTWSADACARLTDRMFAGVGAA
jgi:hypothetical protein